MGTDVLGILSLLLAVAVGAYLVWARLLRSGAPPQVESKVIVHDRSADTIPPTLRPRSEISPKMVAKQLAKGSHPPPRVPETPARNEVTPGAEAKAPAGAPKSIPPAKTPSKPPAPIEPFAKSASAPPPKAASEGDIEAAPMSASPPSTRIAKASPRQPSVVVPKPAESEPLPRVNIEDDEELEPTKMGAIPKAAPIQPVVERIVFDEAADQAPKGPALALSVFGIGQTDPGKRRKQNQDAFECLPESSVFVVADGMGGHRGGEHASKLAVKTISDAFARKHFDAAAHANIPLEASELARSVQMANTAIFEESKRSRDLEGMGTTVVAARFSEDRRRVYIAHVGDSRCYRLRDGTMKQMTSDHTMADYGVTGPEGAHLSRALGVWPTVPIDMIMAEPKLGDLYLICSDGLTKMIPETTISTQLVGEEDLKGAIKRLIFFANSHGGKDNITVLIVRVVEPGWQPPGETA